jgi:hypothetical protein
MERVFRAVNTSKWTARAHLHAGAFGALLLVLVIYAFLAWHLLPDRAFFAGDEGMKLIQVQSLVRGGWRTASIGYPGHGLDPDLAFFPMPEYTVIVDERIYFHYPLPFAALSSPLYALFGQRGLYVIPLVATVLTGLLVYRWTSRSVPHWKVASILLLAFGTPLFFYSLVFWEHTSAVLLCTVGVYLLSQSGPTSPKWKAIAAGGALGLACWLRAECYVFAVIVVGAWLAIYLKLPWPASGTPATVSLSRTQRSEGRLPVTALLWLGVGLTIAWLPLWAWQQAEYGSFLGPHLSGHVRFVSGEDSTGRGTLRGILEIAYTTLVQGYPARVPTVTLAVAFDVMVVVLWLAPLRKHAWLVLASGILLLVAILPVLVYAGERVVRGLVPVSPIIVFSLLPFGGHQPGQRGRLARYLLVIVLGYIVAVCVTQRVDPGLQWGPRFLLPLYPLLVVAALNALAGLQGLPSGKAALVVFVALATVSVILQVAGVRLLHQKRQQSFDLLLATEELPVAHIVTDVEWYPPEMAELFYKRQFFYVTQQADYEELVGRLCRAGIRRFGWVPLEASTIAPQVVRGGCLVRQRSELVFEIVPND